MIQQRDSKKVEIDSCGCWVLPAGFDVRGPGDGIETTAHVRSHTVDQLHMHSSLDFLLLVL